MLRVRGRGVQADGKAGSKGDLLVTVDVQVPINVNGEQRDAMDCATRRPTIHSRYPPDLPISL